MLSALDGNDRLKLVGAFGAVYFVWGTSYLATMIAVRSLEPLELVCIRGLIGAICLSLWQMIRPAIRLGFDRTTVGWIIITGTIMLVGGHGLLFLGQRTAPSGLSAVMLATIPLWMMVLDVLLYRRRTNFKVAGGILIGIVGVALLVVPMRGGKGSLTSSEALILLASAAFWGGASLLTARKLQDVPAVPRAAGQLLSGAIIAGLLGLALPHGSLHVSWTLVAAILYLGVASSAVTFCAYSWLLTRTSPTAAGTYAFVNPVVAILVGETFAGERITPVAMTASAIVLCAVAIVLLGTSRLSPARDKGQAGTPS